jgi:hypothetical protein
MLRDPDARLLGGIVTVLGVLLVVFGIAWSICLFLAGRFLARRRHWVFCLVVAAFACLFTPFGTVLGVFTIVVLSRRSVRASFSAG